MITGLRHRHRDGFPRLLDDGGARARLRAWPHQPSVASIALTDHTKAPGITTLTSWLDVVRTHGFTSVRTGALSDSAIQPFLEVGFMPIQRLALLRLELHRDAVWPPVHHELRPVRGTRQIATAAHIDHAAFEHGWDLDANAIVDACHATPQHRIRLALTADDQPVGYIVTGRNGAAGFVQRLAVRPEWEGHGVASSLLVDGLGWLQRRKVEDVLVNTHIDNTRALGLYERFGFEPLDETLFVLEMSLVDEVRS